MTDIDIDKSIEIKTSYHLDRTENLTINNIHTARFTAKDDFLNFGYLINTLWIKFDIKSLEESEYILSYGTYFVDHLEVFYVKNNKLVHKYVEPREKKSEIHTYLSNLYAFPFTLKKNDKLTIYFKIHSLKLVNIPYFVKKVEEFNHFTIFNFALSTISFTVLFTVFITNLIFYFVSRKKIFKSYAIYLFASFLFWIVLLVFFNEIMILGYDIHLSCTIYYLIVLFYLISFVNFFIELLRTKFYLKRTTRFLKTITYIVFPIIIIFRIILLETDNLTFIFIVNNLMYLISYIIVSLMIFINIKLLKHSKRRPKALLILWLINASIFLIFLINIRFPLFDLNKLFIIIQIMIIIETILISALLAYYLNLVERKNKKLKLLYKKHKKIALENYRLASIKNILNIVKHQCKQPLNNINSIALSLEVLYERKILKKDVLTQKLNEIENQTEFMNSTLDHFFNYLIVNKDYQNINIKTTINECIDLMSHDIRNLGISIKIKTIYKDLTIKGYKKDLIQVLLILINNSIDSFKKNPSIKSKYIHFQINLDVNQQTLLIMEDNAGGIQVTPIESIFDAAISAKGSTGLGLYIARNLLENMNKNIYCTSYDKKTIFKIRG